jgi:hypothetical protein
MSSSSLLKQPVRSFPSVNLVAAVALPAGAPDALTSPAQAAMTTTVAVNGNVVGPAYDGIGQFHPH